MRYLADYEKDVVIAYIRNQASNDRSYISVQYRHNQDAIKDLIRRVQEGNPDKLTPSERWLITDILEPDPL